MSRITRYVLPILAVVALILVACQPQEIVVTKEVEVVVTQVVEVEKEVEVPVEVEVEVEVTAVPVAAPRWTQTSSKRSRSARRCRNPRLVLCAAVGA